MGQLDDLLLEIRKHRAKYAITENSTKAAKLRHRIMGKCHTDDEWLALQEELREFIESNPSKEEIAELQGCGESLAMICSGIRERRLRNTAK